MVATQTILVCQNKTCRKSGSKQVLAAFEHHSLPNTDIVASGCLGQCGNGPMVLILPDEIWYHKLNPDEVQAIVIRHLQQGTPIKSMLYRKFPPSQTR
ncbi:MAG: (2Fe-2S) ferredoxin domain-containing protein [Elainellaceae cyanobacterium]